MSFEPWSRDPLPCRNCKNIYDDQHGRMGHQLIPCLQAHRRSATGEIALVAVAVTDIGWPCPFAQSLNDLLGLLTRMGSLNMNPKAREIIMNILQNGGKLGALPGGVFTPPGQRPVNEADFDLYDPHVYLTTPNAPRQQQGHFVILKAENHEPLWEEFMPWYMTQISATLNGWSLGEMMIRVLTVACANAGGEMRGMAREMCTRENAAKFAIFVVVLLGLQLSGPGRVIAVFIGAYMTGDMIAQLALLLIEAGRLFVNASTEADLDKCGMALARFFAQIAIFAGAALAGEVLAVFMKAVFGAAVKQLENAAKEDKPLTISAENARARRPGQLATLDGPHAKVPTGKPLPPWTERLWPSAKRIAATKEGPAFFDAPQDFSTWDAGRIRNWLKKNGFTLIKKAETFETKSGTKRTASSEIWLRSRPVQIPGTQVPITGKVEAVRIDEFGHETNPNFAGAKPHVHMDLVDYQDSQAYLNMYVPELPTAYKAGAPVPKYTPAQPFNGKAAGKQEPTNPTYFPDTHSPIKPKR